jgi:hypothetical protein
VTLFGKSEPFSRPGENHPRFRWCPRRRPSRSSSKAQSSCPRPQRTDKSVVMKNKPCPRSAVRGQSYSGAVRRKTFVFDPAPAARCRSATASSGDQVVAYNLRPSHSYWHLVFGSSDCILAIYSLAPLRDLRPWVRVVQVWYGVAEGTPRLAGRPLWSPPHAGVTPLLSQRRGASCVQKWPGGSSHR